MQDKTRNIANVVSCGPWRANFLASSRIHGAACGSCTPGARVGDTAQTCGIASTSAAGARTTYARAAVQCRPMLPVVFSVHVCAWHAARHVTRFAAEVSVLMFLCREGLVSLRLKKESVLSLFGGWRGTRVRHVMHMDTPTFLCSPMRARRWQVSGPPASASHRHWLRSAEAEPRLDSLRVLQHHRSKALEDAVRLQTTQSRHEAGREMWQALHIAVAFTVHVKLPA